MPRSTYAVPRHKRISKLLKRTAGYRGHRSHLHRAARETYYRALRYAFRDRRAKKDEFRRLWITRISAALYPYEMSYSKFIGALHRANINVNRKILSEMAINDPKGFEEMVAIARKNLA